MGDPNCYTNNYLDNCYACPNGKITDLSNCVANVAKRKRIWNQSRMSSSMGLLKRKTMVVSRQIGQGAPMPGGGNHERGTVASFLQVGGPGDMQSAIQKSVLRGDVGPQPCYNMGRLRNRTAYNNKKGVDRKHGSYDRYLARRVGGVLRKETTELAWASDRRVAYVGQPRNRTGTKVSTNCNGKGMTSGKRWLSFSCSGGGSTGHISCCENRIPSYSQLKAAGGDSQNFADGTYCNKAEYKRLTSGNCGNPGVCVAGKCSCK